MHGARLHEEPPVVDDKTSSACCDDCCRITVTYYDEKDKSETTVLVPIGENLLEAAHQNNVDLEGGAACVANLTSGRPQ